jgi:hypothetical protein
VLLEAIILLAATAVLGGVYLWVRKSKPRNTVWAATEQGYVERCPYCGHALSGEHLPANAPISSTLRVDGQEICRTCQRAIRRAANSMPSR